MPDPIFADLVVPEFIHQIDAFMRLGQRLLASFGDIAQQAREESHRAWMEHQSQLGEGDPEPSAEAASDAAIELYASLVATRQAAMNLLAAGLRHLFEQQQKSDRCTRAGDRCGKITWDTCSTWKKVDELLLVANTVKHAEGRSARELRGRRPDLFLPPELARLGANLPPVPVVRQPLAGVDLYVTEKDLEDYADALRAVWREVAEVFR
jgi:hypothetical protein